MPRFSPPVPTAFGPALQSSTPPGQPGAYPEICDPWAERRGCHHSSRGNRGWPPRSSHRKGFGRGPCTANQASSLYPADGASRPSRLVPSLEAHRSHARYGRIPSGEREAAPARGPDRTPAGQPRRHPRPNQATAVQGEGPFRCPDTERFAVDGRHGRSQAWMGALRRERPRGRPKQLTEIATGKPARLRVGKNGGGERVRGRWQAPSCRGSFKTRHARCPECRSGIPGCETACCDGRHRASSMNLRAGWDSPSPRALARERVARRRELSCARAPERIKRSGKEEFLRR